MPAPDKAPDIIITSEDLSTDPDGEKVTDEKLVFRGDLPPVTQEMVEAADKQVLAGGLAPSASSQYLERAAKEARDRQLGREVGLAVERIHSQREQ